MKYKYIFFALIFSTVSFAQSSVNEDMKTYLTKNGTVAYYSSVVDRMFDFLKKEYETKNVPETVWEDMAKIKPDALNEITEMLIQTYEGQFSQDEMRVMLDFFKSDVGDKILQRKDLSPTDVEARNAFYETEVGKKIGASKETLNTVLQKVTQEWSAQMFRDVQAKLEEKGFVKD